MDGDTFYEFMSLKLLPLQMPFDGKNHHSFVAMDNASVHHVDGISEPIGALLIYLPPYLPDYNPTEEAFSKVKTVIKTYEQEFELGGMDLKDLVLLASGQITPTDY